MPLAAEWTPDQVRGDGVGGADVPSNAQRETGRDRPPCGRPIGPAGQVQTPRHPGLVPGSTGPRGDVLASGGPPRRGVDPGTRPG
ncbi:hypothetical protein WR25_17303 [Diploscapter pachys]|uniref:Uncharacterized protein n=1 Tax=Diploscapter pachys TaxID=2018661 RepID=A0A2A2M509_9BILA|nr:hypothetical protein WR25_17303 [Diploscapter pachys]